MERNGAVFVFAFQNDGRRFGQCLNSHGQKDRRPKRSVGAARIIRVLFADLCAALKYRGNTLAKTREKSYYSSTSRGVISVSEIVKKPLSVFCE